ncbi:MAG: glycosyl hydrolase 115 family protein [Acidobacteriota bacterium]
MPSFSAQRLCVAVFLLCSLPIAAGAQQPPQPLEQPLEIHAGIPIIVDRNEDTAIVAAVADLRRDLQKVLGSSSPILYSDQAAPSGLAILIARTESASASRDVQLATDESYSITRTSVANQRIVLHGHDVRGTIYSIYEFSDRALGIPPLWFWSGWQPHRQSSITLSPSLFRNVNGPSVQWRAWFPNDTDMLYPWLSASDSHIDLFLETLLRLRFNVLDVDHISNWNNHPNMGLELARRCRGRGIKVTFTHLAPFGFLLGDWDQYWNTVRHMPSPPLRLSNLSALDEFWTYAIHFSEEEHLDVIQSIEFRVDGDKPFWRTFQDAPQGDAQRAEIISAMLDHEMKLLRKVSHAPIPLTRTVFYNEVGEFLDQGKLTPPHDPMLLWNYANEQRDHYPRPEIFTHHSAHQDFGYYLNLQFFTTGSHLVAGEGPWKVEQNLRSVTSALRPGNLRFVVLNVGNFREFSTEISVAAAMLWDSSTSADDAMLDFAARYFDPAQAASLRGLYHAFYDTYWQQRKSDIKGFDRQYIFHDLRYARAAETLLSRIESGRYTADVLFHDPHMLRIVPDDSVAADEPHAIVAGTSAAIDKLTRLLASVQGMAQTLPSDRSAFFDEALISDIRFMLASNIFLRHIAQAYISIENRDAAKADLDDAASQLQLMRRTVASRGRPYLSDWYEHESKFDLDSLARRLKQARDTVL